MNLFSFAAAGMVPTPSSGGGGGDPPPSAEITIVVDAETREPKAEPDSAWVAPGGEIVWRCADPFEIICNLMWSGDRVSRRSRKEDPGGMHVVRVDAGSFDGRYSYGIAVEGAAEVDPDVIIGPRVNR